MPSPISSHAVTAGIDGLLLRPLAEFKLKGKKETVSVIEVVARASVVSGEQHSLCSRFADALAAFRNERWGEAAKLIQDIVERSDDGPSFLYLDHCKQYIRHPPQRDRRTVIHMDAKLGIIATCKSNGCRDLTLARLRVRGAGKS